ncbi:ArsR/SmtB family transcription factor [Alloalcanivorax mobilis]|uniref:ArsR/SmtB family transcription factor n=1 Tax=Alloalcanivorax mobilis TaxID=2019569 RepID=UPI000C7704AC|nr:metalloregulator ArsR/SmtB family transcription factor [Alloalcanivorax mobilis]
MTTPPGSHTASPKLTVLKQFARVAKALGHEYRLVLLELLAQGEQSVEGLARHCRQPVANISQHLQQLRRAGLVQARRDGKYVRYRLSGDEVLTLVSALERVAERNLTQVRDTVQLYYHARDDLEPVTVDELMRRLRDSEVTVLDVRPGDEFVQGHVPGAINIPFHELEARLHELPDDREIVAYCRGPYCMLAFETVARLRHAGRAVRRLKEGFPKWREQGLPTEVGV